MNFNNIPNELKQSALWCVWKYNNEHGKIPHNPRTGGNAQSNNPDTFSDFQTACKKYNTGSYDGLGIGIFNNIGAIDIDNCISDEVFSDMAQDIIDIMGSYTEISPSGKGIRIIFSVEDFQYDRDSYYINNRKRGLEVYISGTTNKFVTITGNAINDMTVVDGSLKLGRILDLYMRRSDTNATRPQNSFVAVADYLKIGLEKDEKLIAYWNGYRPLESESENDMGFMSKLLYWCNGNSDEAIKAFMSSPYTSQKDEKHLKKLERNDYLIGVAKAAMPTITAAQNDELWKKDVQMKDFSNKEEVKFTSPPTPLCEVIIPEFPVDSLPSIVADFVMALSANTQTSSEMSGILALGVLASVMQGKYMVNISKDYSEQLSLYW